MSEWIEVLETEVVAFLKQVEANAAQRRSNKLADLLAQARSRGARGVDRVLPFLRRHQLLSIDREARLALTPQALQLLGDEPQTAREHLREALLKAFPDQLALGDLACASRGEPKAGAGATRISQTQSSPSKDPGADFDIDEAPPVRAPRRAAVAGEAGLRAAVSAQTTPVERATRRDAALKEAVVVGGTGNNTLSAPLRNQLREEHPGDLTRAPDQKAEGISATTTSSSSSSAAPDTLVKPTLGPRYARYDALGKGPLCTVFRGRHSALGIDVAIKELQEIVGYLAFLSREALLDRLQKCLMLQASLRHPCITSVLDIDLTAARPYFVLEFCPGGNLRQKLEACGGEGLELEEGLRSFGQLLHALQFMHAQGLTHGNLKPENLLFDRFGNTKLSDPGHAQLTQLDSDKGQPRLFIGTGGLDYVCREKLRGVDSGAAEEARLGITADLYGAGVLLYEMLTGHLPGVRAPLPSEVNKHVPASLDTIFERLTTGIAASRFQSCADVLAALHEAGDLPVRFDPYEVLVQTAEQVPRGPSAHSANSQHR
ncbi:MAG: serine/threonine protein kinase [Myxococcales bacterium]|jgi:hypothetical protein|nr:serine/threonine protein kinase [Myxococcales bacterium]